VPSGVSWSERWSESNVFCRNRGSKLPHFAGYSSINSFYSAPTRTYSVGARFGARSQSCGCHHAQTRAAPGGVIWRHTSSITQPRVPNQTSQVSPGDSAKTPANMSRPRTDWWAKLTLLFSGDCAQPRLGTEAMEPQSSLWPPAKGGLMSSFSLHPSLPGRANRRVPSQGAGGRMRTDQSLPLRRWHQQGGRAVLPQISFFEF